MNRPYCVSELSDIEKDIYAKHKLSDVVASHIPCMHSYRVKKGGRKEQHIRESLNTDQAILDDQTCSVCFKTRTSSDASHELPADSEPLTRDKLDKIDMFYRWLYRHDF